MSNLRRIANEIITGEVKTAVLIHKQQRLCGGFKKAIEKEKEGNQQSFRTL